MNPLSMPALATVSSKNAKQAGLRAMDLYRAFLRKVPYIKNIHDLPQTQGEIRSAINYHFRKNIAVQDPKVIDLLVFKGQTELDEVLLQYKQRSHITRLLHENTRFGR